MTATLTAARIPESHLDLAECPPIAALSTVMPDGSPQTSVVWCDLAGGHVRLNTMRGFQKERNMRRDPKVKLLCYDPREPSRYLASYYGYVFPLEQRRRETRVIVRIRARRISLDAIHA